MKIPKEVYGVARTLNMNRFEAYLVGGCVRDLLLHKEPKDWDIATNANPEQIQKVFPESVYENLFGTVGVKTESDDLKLKVIEVTTFRKDGAYADKRHPESVTFSKTIAEDVSRRDFTINALAMELQKKELIDLFEGREDLKNKIIRTVGDPDARFNEDALRLLRAVRFAAELGFTIEEKIAEAIKKHAGLLEAIAKERIRDEFQKIIMSSRAMSGIQMLQDYGLLKFILPELQEGIDCGQNKHHIYSVWEHNLRALDYTTQKNYSFAVRMASLLHDVGKPRSKRGNGPESTFYGHDTIGAKMTLKILDRLHFSKDFVEQVAHLVRYHLFYYNVGEVTEAGVRRFLKRVGPENIDDLMKVREADRIGSGVPKAVPYKLRHLLFMIDKVKRDPISPKMIKLNGNELMSLLNLPPSPKIGAILSVLLEEVIEDPKRNTKKYLESRAEKLNEFSDKELQSLAKKAKSVKDEFEARAEEDIKKKHYVK